MTRFRYLADSLFWTAAALYAVNRLWLKPYFAWPFLHSYFNDLLLIPAALPVVLWIQRRTGLRRTDDAPSWLEILGHLAVWSVICEFIGPFILKRGTADFRDVLCYALGGVAAWFWWNRLRQSRTA